MAHEPQAAPAGTRTVPVDLVVALLIFALGALVIWDSYRLGSGWAPDGPEAGYFPFYIGLLTCICGTVVFVQSLLKLKSDRTIFVTHEQLKQVLVILLPSTLYVMGVQWIGIYVSSAVFIVLFMKFAGHYSWLRSVAVGAGVSLTAFVLFEIWFRIPLPKGPVEHMLGY
jgi:putative tricarboxylic transport membrane protein